MIVRVVLHPASPATIQVSKIFGAELLDLFLRLPLRDKAHIEACNSSKGREEVCATTLWTLISPYVYGKQSF